LPAGLPTILNSGGPCRTGSDKFVVWHVAHCCSNSVGPSGGFAAGSGICAPVVFTTSNAPQIPSPIACVARGFAMYTTVGVRRL